MHMITIYIKMNLFKMLIKYSKPVAFRATSTHLVLLEEPDWSPPLAARSLHYWDGQLGL